MSENNVKVSIRGKHAVDELPQSISMIAEW